MISKPVTKYKKIHYKQKDQSDCGVACLKSILRYFGHDVPIEELREISGTTIMGNNMNSIRITAIKLGLICKGYRASITDLMNLNRPAILLIQRSDASPHFIVVYRYTKDGLLSLRFSKDQRKSEEDVRKDRL